MCGIAGCLSRSRDPRSLPEILSVMARSLMHRGPDQQGTWFSPRHYVGLAHRRLSIIDISDAGRQPMQSPSGRYVVVFNGEIYNHLDLRRQLEADGEPWIGHSDTETLVHAFESWGVQGTLVRTIGMFAIAVWDSQERTLILARDRLGEKPLYYGWGGDTFIFGSELKAMRQHPQFEGIIDRDALSLLMRHNYIPTPFSIYKGVKKLEPGTLLYVRLGGEVRCETYWSAEECITNGAADPFRGSRDDLSGELDVLLRDAVQRQMAADVPLGAFLSGGIDSSLIVALMQSQSTRPVKTFTIGFSDPKFNEACHAKAVARHLGTEHTELYINEKEAQTVVPNLAHIYDEPFSDSSQIPTILVAQLARKHVTVSLSGDGGDELFAGYSRYTITSAMWNRVSRMPIGLRRLVGATVRRMSPAIMRIGELGGSRKYAHFADKLVKGADVLASQDVDELYWNLVSHWRNPNQLVIGGNEPERHVMKRMPPLGNSAIARMMSLDLVSYLPDDILCKVDRAAMSVSLETRVPLLDHRVVEFAWRVPHHLKIENGVGKLPLRDVLSKYVPKDLVERPKMGFGIPVGDWLKNGLRDWAEDLLSEACLRDVGALSVGHVRRKWFEHTSGIRNWQYHLWDVLMFQAWAKAARSN